MGDWMQEVRERVQTERLFQISIDAIIWTVDARSGVIEFYNDLGRHEHFQSAGDLVDGLQSWYENPTIVVL